MQKFDLEALVLGIVARQPSHGYAILKELRERSDGMISLREGKLYPLLHSMEKGGLISSEWQPESNGPPRKVYSIATKGKRELESRAKAWNQLANHITAILNPSQEEASHG